MQSDRTVRPDTKLLAVGLLAALAIANEFSLAYLFASDRAITGNALIWVRGLDAILVALIAGLPWWAPVPGKFALAAFRRAPNAAALVVGLGGIGSILVALELCFHAYNVIHERNHPRPYKTYSASLLQWPVVCRSTRVDGDHLNYDVTYTIDERGARVTPASAPEPTGRDVVFFGGSYTFGEGVEDDQTLPNQVARRAPGWRVTNFGFPGYGPGQMLRRIEDPQVLEPFKNSDARAIYTYISRHPERVVGNMRITTSWARDFPHFVLTPEGALEYRGTMTEGRPIRSRIYHWLSKDPALKFFDLDWPVRVTHSGFELTARIVEESRNRWVASLNPASFIVVIYPSNGKGHEPNDAFIPYLELKGISYLDYSERFEGMTDVWIPGDGHPTAAAHQRVAEWLVEDLDLARGPSPAKE